MTPVLRVDVSICVATRRRPIGLARLLDSLLRVKLPDGVSGEVIVVDNDPATDPARPVAGGVALPELVLRRLREPRCSLAYALDTAIEAARGRWLAFLDDDASVDEGWLAAWWRCVEERDADGYFGPVLPRPGAADAPVLGVAPRRPATGAPIDPRGAHLRNALLRAPLVRGAGFDPVFRVHADAEDALMRALAAGGARFEWCDEAVVRAGLRPERSPGLAGRAVREWSRWLARRRGRRAA